MEEIIRKVFSELDSGDFCGCMEGDMSGEYENGIEKFIRLFKKLYAPGNAQQQVQAESDKPNSST